MKKQLFETALQDLDSCIFELNRFVEEKEVVISPEEFRAARKLVHRVSDFEELMDRFEDLYFSKKVSHDS